MTRLAISICVLSTFASVHCQMTFASDPIPAHFSHPYQKMTKEWKWLKGNVHVHADLNRLTNKEYAQHERNESATYVVDKYSGFGYQFLMFPFEGGFLPMDQFAALQFNCNQLVLIPGAELNGDTSGYVGPPHLLLARRLTAEPIKILKAVPNPTIPEAVTKTNDACGLSVAAHPGWSGLEWPGKLLRCDGLDGIEIFNALNHDLESTRQAMDAWDQLSFDGDIRWGFAGDDAGNETEMGQTWIVAHVPQEMPSADDIIAALKAGAFYSCKGNKGGSADIHRGLVIKSIDVANLTVTITTTVNCYFWSIIDKDEPTLLNGNAADVKCVYTVDKDHPMAKYGRFVVADNLDIAKASVVAWTQPFVLVKD